MNTPELHHWQAELASVIEAGAPQALDATLACRRGLASIADGCEAYRNSSTGARMQALALIFPVCKRLLGDLCFDALCRDYVSSSPSLGPDLNRYGGQFSSFVRQMGQAHPSLGELHWLPDLVQLENLLHEISFRDAAGERPITPPTQQDPSSLRIFPLQHIEWMHSRWPVHLIWEAHQGAQDPPALSLSPGDWHLLVQQQLSDCKVMVIEPPIWSLLEASRCGPSVAQLAEQSDLDVARLGELLGQGWIRLQTNNV